MDIQIDNSGMRVNARFRSEDVRDILLPLLRRWANLHQSLGRRTVVFLAAPPGCGKTTLSLFLEKLCQQSNDLGDMRLQALPLDGFHLPNSHLDTHLFEEGGKLVPMRQRKGAPFTYDVDSLTRHLQDLRSAEVPEPWPSYSRAIHDVLPAQLPIWGNVILLEGNYLLLESSPWCSLAQFCDDSLFVSAEEELLHERLVARKACGGTSPDAAEGWFQSNDGPNLRTVLQRSAPANTELHCERDGGITLVRGLALD